MRNRADASGYGFLEMFQAMLTDVTNLYEHVVYFSECEDVVNEPRNFALLAASRILDAI